MLNVMLCLAAAASSAFAQAGGNANPGVLPPNSSPHGHTYAEWNALWWRWFLALPLDSNPANGADCSTGQVGSVWFLVGIPGPTTIYCTVPNGKMLFFPVINTECSNLEPPQFFGVTEADRRACAKKIADGAANLSVTIDGEPVQNLKNYRSSSPDFTFVVPPKNVLGIPPGSGLSVGDGYYLMLAPLSTGTHTIHLTGSFPDFPFAIDTTLILTVGH